MASNSWRYMVAFLRECHGSGIVPIRDLFMACIRLCRGQRGYYLTARSGFRLSGAPSNNKGWKARFFFISHGQGWGFQPEGTAREGASLSRKKKKVTISKPPRKDAPGGASERAQRSKGKEPARETMESPDHPPTMRELCEVDGRVVHLLYEKISSLRAENKELKSGAGPKVMAVTEKRAIELNAEVEQLNVALGESEQHSKDYKLTADPQRAERPLDSRCRLEDEVLALAQDTKDL
ncbi:hypothetical protein BHM03_00015618 [Ensete ventricosum]|nr:hypothetical protein BHM03_00015618 [Ensete ventricosum]